MTTVKELKEILENYSDNEEIYFEFEGYNQGGDTEFSPMTLSDDFGDKEGVVLRFVEN